MNVIDYITITCNIKKKSPITDYIRLHDKMQSITTDYDDTMSANQHQELPVGPVNYCLQRKPNKNKIKLTESLKGNKVEKNYTRLWIVNYSRNNIK
jgi:hypothetical protein